MANTFTFDVLLRVKVAQTGRNETEAHDKLTALMLNPARAVVAILYGAGSDSALELPLYYVRASNLDGSEGSADLFVRAKDREDVLRFWRTHYELGETEQPYRVYELATMPREGVIPWADCRTE
jgi:hypothetical protein